MPKRQYMIFRRSSCIFILRDGNDFLKIPTAKNDSTIERRTIPKPKGYLKRLAILFDKRA
jgi:hypothetical protein